MNVNFVKEFGTDKYIIIDPNDEVQMKNLEFQFKTPVFYIFNPKTQQTTKLSNPQVKQLFSSNISKLEEILNLIIKRNVDNKYEEIKDEFRIDAKNIFNNEINSKTFVKYIGNFNSFDQVPDELYSGDIFEINNEYKTEYYIVLNKDEIVRLYTKDEVDSIFSNYYKNNQIDEFINKMNDLITSNNKTLNDELIKLSLSLSGYVTNNFLNLTTSKYNEYIDNYKNNIKNDYHENINLLQTFVNDEINKIKVNTDNKINDLTNNYLKLINEVNNDVKLFKTNTILLYEDKLKELNLIINDLEIKINELEFKTKEESK